MVIYTEFVATFVVLHSLATRSIWKPSRREPLQIVLSVNNEVSNISLVWTTTLLTLPSGDDRVARSARAVRVGTLRPAIVLYDEPHPLGDDIAAIQTSDLSKRPDLLIIMGTSLKVHGLKKLVKEFAKAVHHGSTSSSSTAPPKVIFVNKTAPAAEWAGVIDLHVQGTSDAWVERVIADWKHSKPVDWEAQPTLKDVLGSKNTKPAKVANPAAKPTKPRGEKSGLSTLSIPELI
jgi:NAD-dependent histone deacetylase SIR2